MSISGYADNRVLGNKLIVDDNTSLGNYARKSAERCAKAKCFIDYRVEVRKIVQSPINKSFFLDEEVVVQLFA